MNKYKSTLKYEAATQHIGLENNSENNCFLNVTIQALWHLGPFRIELQKITNQIDIEKNSILRSDLDIMSILCNLFTEYKFTNFNELSPIELRIALSSISEKFELGSMADSNEALDAILNLIHQQCVPKCGENNKKCLAHQVFGAQLLEYTKCRKCGGNILYLK